MIHYSYKVQVFVFVFWQQVIYLPGTIWSAICNDYVIFLTWRNVMQIIRIKEVLKKQRHYFADKGPSSQSYGFSSSHTNHLICCPLLLLPSIFPSLRVFSNEPALCFRWPKYCSFSFSISPSNEYSGLISFRMDWLDLLEVQGTLKSLLQHHSSKASILWLSAFFIVQLSLGYHSKHCQQQSYKVQNDILLLVPVLLELNQPLPVWTALSSILTALLGEEPEDRQQVLGLIQGKHKLKALLMSVLFYILF